jgi:hypothetical protein
VEVTALQVMTALGNLKAGLFDFDAEVELMEGLEGSVKES